MLTHVGGFGRLVVCELAIVLGALSVGEDRRMFMVCQHVLPTVGERARCDCRPLCEPKV
jgi:hypothetical protein